MWSHLACMTPQKHIHHLIIIFLRKIPISKKVVQESNLNQIDGWVRILWEHLNYIQQKRTLLGPGWVSTLGTLANDMPHVTKFVECLPWERWAVNSLIIMIYYNLEGIELFQKLYKWLEHMVPKDMRNSSKINKAVREFCKFSQRVKLWIKVFIINKIVNIQGFREKPQNPQNVFLECLIMWFFYFPFSQQPELYSVN